MRIVQTPEHAKLIGSVDLRAEALAALARGDQPGYARTTEHGLSGYTGPVEVLTVGTRAGVATNGPAQWGDVETDTDGQQVVVLDEKLAK